MLNKKSGSILLFVIGMLIGLLITGVGGIFLSKAYRAIKEPKRFDARYPSQKGEEFTAVVASSLDKIFLDGKTLVKPIFSDSASLSVAKNEYESFQVVIKTNEKELNGIWLNISEPIDNATGAKIDAKNILWRVVGYVPSKRPYYPVKYVGKWPDPLLPAKKMEIAPQTAQPFWVTVYIPPEATIGHYRATIKIMSDNVSLREIPFEIHIYNFTLPKANHLKTAFDFYGHITKKRFSQGENESAEAYQARINVINEKFIIAMLKYRMNPILNIDPASDGDLGRVDRYLWHGLNNFSIGKKGGTFGNNWPSNDDAIEGLLSTYQTYAETLKLSKMLQYTYIYTWDEGGIGNPRVKKLCAMIHRAHPGLKNMVCYHGFWDPDKDPEWGKDIDIWSFQLDGFNENKMRKIQNLGKEIWMYASGPSGNGSPNLVIDFDSIDYRIIPWLCWKYDIKGFLYWCVNWWPTVDPFKSAANSQWEQNGNGLLFYPGEDGPMASLRLEVFRDGMEDYEYIQLLIQKIKEMKKEKLDAGHEALIEDCIKILTVDKSIAESMTDFTKDGKIILSRRDAIAQKIEMLDQFLGAQSKESPNPDGK